MTEALVHFPDDASLLTNAAIAASQSPVPSRWHSGLNYGLRALQVDPSTAQAHHVVGNLYQQVGNEAAAEQHFARASLQVQTGLDPTLGMVSCYSNAHGVILSVSCPRHAPYADRRQQLLSTIFVSWAILPP